MSFQGKTLAHDGGGGSGAVKGDDLPKVVKPSSSTHKTNALAKTKTGAEEEEVTAESLQRGAKERTYTARATIIGNPNIQAGMLIEINNVGKKYGGKWWVKTVRHKISTSGFLTELELQRDALGTKDGTAKGRDSGVVTKNKTTKATTKKATTTPVTKSTTTAPAKSTNTGGGKRLQVNAETGEYTWVSK